MIKIGFTGTQQGMTPWQKLHVEMILKKAKEDFQEIEFHHGDCVGADSDAHDEARKVGADIVIHPPENDSKRAFRGSKNIRQPKPYLSRNHDIVDETEFLIATPKEKKEVLRSGTWATVRYAKKLDKRGIIIYNGGYEMF